MSRITVLSRGKFYSFAHSGASLECTVTGARFKSLDDLLGRFGTPLFGCVAGTRGAFSRMVSIYLPRIGFPCLPESEVPTHYRDMARESDAAILAMGPMSIDAAAQCHIDPSSYVGRGTDLLLPNEVSTASLPDFPAHVQKEESSGSYYSDSDATTTV